MVKSIVVTIFAVLLVACANQRGSVCKEYPDICDALEKNQTTTVVVSLMLKANQEAFKDFLSENNIALVVTIEATDQTVVEVNAETLQLLWQYKDVSDIQLDKFYPK